MFGIGKKAAPVTVTEKQMRHIDDIAAELGSNKVFKQTIAPASLQPSAESILDEAVSKMIVDRDHHAERVAYWSEVVNDARQRLRYHSAIHDALETAIKPMTGAMDINFSDEMKEFENVFEPEGNPETAGGKSDVDAVEPANATRIGGSDRSRRVIKG